MRTLERAFELVVKLYEIHFRFKLIVSRGRTNENENTVDNNQYDGGKRPGEGAKHVKSRRNFRKNNTRGRSRSRSANVLRGPPVEGQRTRDRVTNS